MSNVIPFNFEDHAVRVVTRDGEPWWVLADVCKVLDLKNPTHSANRLDDDERATLNVGRQGEATIINESGLYSVILKSPIEARRGHRSGFMVIIPDNSQGGLYGLI